MKVSPKRSSERIEPALSPAERRRYLEKLLKQLLAGEVSMDPKATAGGTLTPYRRVIE